MQIRKGYLPFFDPPVKGLQWLHQNLWLTSDDIAEQASCKQRVHNEFRSTGCLDA